MPVKSPPSFSVAEVRIVVRSPNTCRRISADTDNGDTRASRPNRSRSATQTTSCSFSAAIRSAMSKTSCTAAAACRLSASSFPSPPVIALTAERAALRTVAHAATNAESGSSIRSSGVASRAVRRTSADSSSSSATSSSR